MTSSEPTDPLLAQTADDAMKALAGVSHPITEAVNFVPNVAGLYAIHAEPATWQELKIDESKLGVPLYVGKSESSLVVRELKTHFAVQRGRSIKTGGSTVRRSFAALLRDSQGFRGRPRDAMMNPKYFATYSLAADDDMRLTEWMHERLSIAVWPKPAGLSLPLRDVEGLILARWTPPLNIQDVPSPLPWLRVVRARMQADAEEWARGR